MIDDTNKQKIKELCIQNKSVKEISEITKIPYLSVKGFVTYHKLTHRTKHIDLTNQEIGRLTVLYKTNQTKSEKKLWKCKCICGNICLASTSDLRSGDVKSCGCLKEEMSREMCKKTSKEHHAWKGFGDLPGGYYRQTILRANRRKIEFSISIEEIWELFLLQDRRCAYTGRYLTFNKNSRDHKGTASLDRVDSSKGYVKGNVQWVHKDINKMKLIHKEKDFLEIIKEVYEYRILTKVNL